MQHNKTAETDSRQKIEAMVKIVNDELGSNFVHTFQFVSVDESVGSDLTWWTYSVQLPKYRMATEAFTGYTPQDQKIKRSRLTNQIHPISFRQITVRCKTGDSTNILTVRESE